MERLCGNCAYGATAYTRYGEEDENFVICQIKEHENLNRKPDRYSTSSAVSRMHVQRDACLNWRPVAEPSRSKEQPLHLAQTPPQTDADYDLIRPAASVSRSQEQEELKKLKLMLIQKDQMVTSLQTQNVFLSEQLSELQQEMAELKRSMQQVRYFDPTLLAQMDYFALLGIGLDSKPDEIKDAYRNKMKFYHPDRFATIARLLNQAYETLMDTEARTKYLQKLRAERHPGLQ
ncbi:MAG: J domain-containing protein [Candidatus Sericytochromatia bacterium]